MTESDDNFPDFSDGLAKTYLQNQFMDAMEAYKRRGRSLKRLEDQQLEQQWIAAMNAWADAASEGRVFDLRERNDAEAEMALRGIEPPSNKIPAVWEKLRAAVWVAISDPVQREKVIGRLEEDLAEFEESVRRKPSN